MDVDDSGQYVIEGRILKRLFRIAERFNDGMKLNPNERRDLAQEMRAKLETAERWVK